MAYTLYFKAERKRKIISVHELLDIRVHVTLPLVGKTSTYETIAVQVDWNQMLPWETSSVVLRRHRAWRGGKSCIGDILMQSAEVTFCET